MFFINEIYSLQILEPISKDLKFENTVDIGYVCDDESFLVSFLLDDGEYNKIELSPNSQDIAFIENTQKTKESIFTTIKINKDVSGKKELKLILRNTINEKYKEVILETEVTDSVISAVILPYNKYTRYDSTKEINVKLINKSNSTKQVILDSSLPNHWYNSMVLREKKFTLQPNSIQTVKYSFIPKNIGHYEFDLFVYTKYNKTNTSIPGFTNVVSNKIKKPINIKTIKDLKSIIGVREYNFPVFGLNTSPIYYFNNIIKILS